MTIYKRVFDFDMYFCGRGIVGDRYTASGTVGGRTFSASLIFSGYNKKDIARRLKRQLLDKANGKR